MRWQGGRRSSNVEDRRGMGGGMAAGGGLGIIGVILYLLLGGDPSAVPTGGDPQQPAGAPQTAQDDSMRQFVEVVLGYTEDTWNEQFRSSGQAYEEPALVLFSNFVQSACGGATAAVGP